MSKIFLVHFHCCLLALKSSTESAFQVWRRVLFKKMVLRLGLDHLRFCCGPFFFLFQLELSLHTPNNFSASPVNTDFSACSGRREQNGEGRNWQSFSVIFLLILCGPPSLSRGTFTRNQKHALMSADVSVLLSQFMHMSEFSTALWG